MLPAGLVEAQGTGGLDQQWQTAMSGDCAQLLVGLGLEREQALPVARAAHRALKRRSRGVVAPALRFGHGWPRSLAVTVSVIS